MITPVGLLHNLLTGRWHPIVFRRAPKPSEYGEATVRHRSRTHHQEGFDTPEGAEEYVKKFPELTFVPGAAWEWDGIEVPATVAYFHNPLGPGEED